MTYEESISPHRHQWCRMLLWPSDAYDFDPDFDCHLLLRPVVKPWASCSRPFGLLGATSLIVSDKFLSEHTHKLTLQLVL